MTAKDHFFQMKKDQELNISVYAALDKMRIDFQDGGRGLLIPHKLGVISCIELYDDKIITRSKDKTLSPTDNLVSGSTRITLHSTSGVKKGQELSIHDRQKGETVVALSVDKESVVLTSPIKFTYSLLTAEVFSVKKISFYLEQNNRILRRKVNSSPAQPLLHEVEAVEFSYDGTSNLVNVNLSLTEEKTYEIYVFPKNMDLASAE